MPMTMELSRENKSVQGEAKLRLYGRIPRIRPVNIRLMENVHHWPTLKTMLMVEQTLKDADGPISLEELKRRLRKQVMDQTLRLILAYLEGKGSILIGPKGISWIENESSKFMEFIKKSKVLSSV